MAKDSNECAGALGDKDVSGRRRFKLDPRIWQCIRFTTCPVAGFLFLVTLNRLFEDSVSYCDDFDIVIEYGFVLYPILTFAISTLRKKSNKRIVDISVIFIVVLYLMYLLIISLLRGDELGFVQTMTVIFLTPMFTMFFFFISGLWIFVITGYALSFLLFVAPWYLPAVYISRRSSNDLVALSLIRKLDRLAQWTTILLLLAIIAMALPLHVGASNGEMWHLSCW